MESFRRKINYIIAALFLAIALTVSGCSEASAGSKNKIHTPPQIPGSWQLADDVKVYVPTWLSLDSELKQRAFDEIKTTPGLNVAGQSVGVPQDWQVKIQDPGLYSFEGSPTYLAFGHVNYVTKTIHIAWRGPGSRATPLLPALAHEIAHIYNGPCANHADCSIK